MIRSTSEVRRALGWLLGGATQNNWTAILAMLPYLLIGLGILVFSGHVLNLLQFGDDQAQQLGLNVTRTKRILLFASSLTTASAVAFSGITHVSGYPFSLATIASAMPVLPEVGSSRCRPAVSSPVASAASIIDRATRSLIEPEGF